MKLSSSANALYNAFGRDAAFAYMAELGYTGLDYDISFPQEFLSEDPATFEKRFKTDAACAKQAGLTIALAHAPYPVYTEGHPEKLEDGIAAQRKAAIATALLGCDTMVMHGAMPHWKTLYDAAEFEAINRHVFESVLPLAEEYKVRIALENMPGVPFMPDEAAPVTSQPETLIRYIDMMHSPYFAACLDTGHANCAHISPAEYAEKLGDRIIALHIHDNLAHDDAHGLPYTGNIDWADFARALKKIGYDGWLNLEWRNARFPKEHLKQAEQFAFDTLRHFAETI